jgi:hypothetical protein
MHAERPTRLRRFIPVLVGVLLATTFPAIVASDHGGRPIGALFACDRPVTPPRCTSVADNMRHLVHFDATLTEPLRIAMRAALAVYDGTEMIVSEQARPNRMTDVVVFSQDYGDNGAAGWVYCPPDAPQGVNPVGDRWCRLQELHLNVNARYGAFFADDGSRAHVTCHELGHTVGLRHWGNPPQTSGSDVGATCMNANTPDGPTTLHQIDVEHINAYAYRQGPSRRHQILQTPTTPELRRLLHPWAGTLQATELEQAASLEELVRSADAVVRGQIVAVEPGRVFGAPGKELHYASATLRVDDLIAGSSASTHATQLTVEIPLFDGPDSISRLPDWGHAAFILRNKGTSARESGLGAEHQAEEARYYRLLSFGSLVVDDAGVAVTDPDAPLLADLDGKPFEQVVERLESIGR